MYSKRARSFYHVGWLPEAHNKVLWTGHNTSNCCVEREELLQCSSSACVHRSPQLRSLAARQPCFEQQLSADESFVQRCRSLRESVTK